VWGFLRVQQIHRLVNYQNVMSAAAVSSSSRAGALAEPRTRDADRTQQEILRGAMAEFAEKGLGGARIDAIAERAGVNKRLLYYYFENKDDLFLAALELTY